MSIPEHLLPDTPGVTDGESGLVIAEIAGRDSIAALVALAQTRDVSLVLPTIASTSTEYGDPEAPLRAIERARELLPDVVFAGPVHLAEPTLWAALNGRYGAELQRRFGFWSPCAACHLYVHLVRVPLAWRVSAPIVTGERDQHDGRFKLSQTPLSTDACVRVLSEFGVELLEPIRDVDEGGMVSRLVGGSWDEGGGQLECVLSGNFRDADGRTAYGTDGYREYVSGFFEPAARAVLSAWQDPLAEPDYSAIVARVLEGAS